jgi:hypothetical protein
MRSCRKKIAQPDLSDFWAIRSMVSLLTLAHRGHGMPSPF